MNEEEEEEMKRKSKWLGLFLALGLVVAACSPATTPTTTTSAATTTTAGETTTTEAPAELLTDVGVDVDAKTITIGLLSDLTGPFSSLVQVIVAGHEIYWDSVNDAGGIGGFEVVLDVRDTAYDPTQHVQRYEEMKTSVVAFGHSTGSPQTMALITPTNRLAEDEILAIPLTWYSGWTDPQYNANLLHHGTNYCLEAMNVIGFVKQQMGDALQTIAIASVPGDYGLDSYEGAVKAAEALGIEVVYEARGQVLPGNEASESAVRDGLIASGANMVWLTSTPGSWATIFGQAAGQMQAVWSGAAPSYNPAFLQNPQLAAGLAQATFWGSYYSPWSSDAPGVQDAIALVEAANALGGNKVSAVFEGFVEAQIMHAVLQAAFDANDLTQAGVLRAATTVQEVDFNGLAPNETFVGGPNDRVQRATTIWRPDPEGLLDGTHAGEAILVENFVHPITQAYVFESACYEFGS
jgi:ABC-type branched-subunit amino acid transport system substrate-binding protein